MELKITMHMCSGENCGQKDNKKTKKIPTATSEEPGAKTGYWEKKQGTKHAPGEGNGNPLQCSCLQNPRDGGA